MAAKHCGHVLRADPDNFAQTEHIVTGLLQPSERDPTRVSATGSGPTRARQRTNTAILHLQIPLPKPDRAPSPEAERACIRVVPRIGAHWRDLQNCLALCYRFGGRDISLVVGLAVDWLAMQDDGGVLRLAMS